MSIKQITGMWNLAASCILPMRLAVSFRMGEAEVAGVAFLERLAFLMPDDHHLVGVELGPAGANRPIVAEELVAVQLDELVEDQLEVIGGHGPIGMPGHLDDLPRLEVGVDPLLQLHQLPPQQADFVADLGRLLSLGLQLLQPGFQLVDRPLERQAVFASRHSGPTLVGFENFRVQNVPLATPLMTADHGYYRVFAAQRDTEMQPIGNSCLYVT